MNTSVPASPRASTLLSTSPETETAGRSSAKSCDWLIGTIKFRRCETHAGIDLQQFTKVGYTINGEGMIQPLISKASDMKTLQTLEIATVLWLAGTFGANATLLDGMVSEFQSWQVAFD